jgi:hypothetical protein
VEPVTAIAESTATVVPQFGQTKLPSSSADEQVAQEMVIVVPRGFAGCYIAGLSAVNESATTSKPKADRQNQAFL